MPNLDFYAVDDDRAAVLEIVFALGLFRVFEAYSEPDHELREFHSPEGVLDRPSGTFLHLLTRGAGPEPTVKRMDMWPKAPGDAAFRCRSDGWGLIQLDFGRHLEDHELSWSHTNHNSEKRAASWAHTVTGRDEPSQWDWPAVTSASSKLNRRIRKLAVSKRGPRPVLPRAAEVIARGVLRYEYGHGIHATDVFGNTTPAMDVRPG